MITKTFFFKITLFSFGLLTFFSAIAQEQITYLTNHPANDRHGRYSPNGELIVFESDRNGNWDIFLLDRKAGTQQQLTSGKADNRYPSWHPSGKKILFTSNGSGKNRLYEIDVETKAITKFELAETLAEVNFSAWSPDGNTIAFSVEEAPNQHNLYLFDVQAKAIQALSSDTTRTLFPDWSPKGNALVFFSRKDTNNEDDEIYVMTIKNRKVKRLTDWPKHNFCPSWSNSGKHIAYVTSMENSRPEIFIMKKNGKRPLRVTYNKTGDTLPDWSPDDQFLLITTYHEGHYEIAEIEIP